MRAGPSSSSHLSNIEAEGFRLLFSEKESAYTLGVSVRTVQTLISTGALRAQRIGRRVLIHRRELEKFAHQDHPTVGGE